jgi:hypothetical protein
VYKLCLKVFVATLSKSESREQKIKVLPSGIIFSILFFCRLHLDAAAVIY